MPDSNTSGTSRVERANTDRPSRFEEAGYSSARGDVPGRGLTAGDLGWSIPRRRYDPRQGPTREPCTVPEHGLRNVSTAPLKAWANWPTGRQPGASACTRRAWPWREMHGTRHRHGAAQAGSGQPYHGRRRRPGAVGREPGHATGLGNKQGMGSASRAGRDSRRATLGRPRTRGRPDLAATRPCGGRRGPRTSEQAASPATRDPPGAAGRARRERAWGEGAAMSTRDSHHTAITRRRPDRRRRPRTGGHHESEVSG